MIRTAAIGDTPLRFHRIQANVVARRERQVLDWLCAQLPAWVTPDHLTLTGVVGAVVAFLGYVASTYSPAFLWVASLGLIVHWFGDSLDGSLARHRRIERPRYGYFLDHTVDAASNLLIMAGIGCTAYVRLDSALLALIGYYLLCIYVFINNHLSGVLRLSFLGFGPTELRLGLVSINTSMFFLGYVGARFGDAQYSIYDGILLFMASVFVGIFMMRMADGVRALRNADVHGGAPNNQSAPRNASNRAK